MRNKQVHYEGQGHWSCSIWKGWDSSKEPFLCLIYKFLVMNLKPEGLVEHWGQW